jgi:hypothetical protein
MSLVCFALSTLDLDLLLRWSDRMAILPTARANYRQIVNGITSATHDDLLEDQTNEEPQLHREGRGCIRASGSRTYGTNRSQEDVQKDYAKAFSHMVWESGETGSGSKTFGTDSETTEIIVEFIEPISPDFSIGKDKYQIIYSVLVIYVDPKIFGCYG